MNAQMNRALRAAFRRPRLISSHHRGQRCGPWRRHEAEPGVTSLPPGSTEAGSAHDSGFRPSPSPPAVEPEFLCFSACRFLCQASRPMPRCMHAADEACHDELFHEIPGNPLPEKRDGRFLTARDGKKLRYGRFDAAGAAAQGHRRRPSRPQRVHREIFRDDRATSRAAASPSPPSTGAARAAPIGCCAIARAAMSRASTTM